MAFRPEHWSDSRFVPSDTPAEAEVFGIGAGVYGAHRYDKAHPIGRRHFTTPPGVGQRHAVLRGHQPGIGGDQGVVAQVILIDPGQPLAPQRGNVVTDQRFGAGVAGLGQQHRAQAGGQILGPCRALGQMGEGVGEAGAGGNLQQDFRQIDFWQPGDDRLPQCHQ